MDNTNTLTLPNDELLGEVEELLRQGQPVRFKPRGRSMEPFIREATDEVILQPIQQLKVGQIVLAQDATRKHILHRIIKIADDKIILMGDGNLKGTETCQRKDICGMVSQIIRKKKRINCQSFSEQWLAHFWMNTLGIRRIFLAIYHLFYAKS